MRALFQSAWLLAFGVMVIAASASRGQTPSKGTVEAALREADESDRTLIAGAGEVRAAFGDPAPPDPAALMREITGSSFADGFRLTQAVEDWHAVGGDRGAWGVVTGSAAAVETRRVRIACRAVLALSQAAIAHLDRAVEAADRSAPVGHAAPNDEEIARAIHLRQVVLPLRSARAAMLLALAEPRPQPRSRLAAIAIEAAARVEPVSAWSEMERLVVSGLALAADERDDEALRVFDKAREVATKEGPAAGLGALAVDTALGEAMSLLPSRGPFTARQMLLERYAGFPFSLAAGRDVRACLAAIDALFVISLAEAASWQDAQKRDAALAAPWIAAHTLACALPAAAQRTVVYDHLGLRAPPVNFEILPPIARAAAAWRAGREDGNEVLIALAPIADPVAPPRDAVERDAWLLFARAGERSDEPSTLARVAALGLAFARCCADDVNGEEIVAASARASEHLLRTSRGEAGAEAESQLLTALRELAQGGVRMDESRRDAWRLALGRALQALIRRGPFDASADSARDAAIVLKSVTRAEQHAEADATLAGAWSALLRIAEDSDLDPATTRGIAQQLEEFTDPKRTRAKSGRWLVDAQACRGQALVALGRPADALNEMEQLLSAEAAEPAPPLALEAAVEAYAGLERADAAEPLLQRLPNPGSLLARLSDRAWRPVAPLIAGFPAEPATSSPVPMAVFRLAAEAANDVESRVVHRSRLGWALLLNDGPDESAAAFESALGDKPLDPATLRGMGEARLAGGDDAAAFAAFRTIAQGFESRGEHPRGYWHAWTRMLEILARRPRTAEGDAMIRREIARLRSLDSALDQPECMVRIRAVEDVLGPR